jgi:CBS domain containing-hemolysin-like protein
VQILSDYAVWLAALGVLILLSGFFSSSEAALFYLSPKDRRKLASGGRAGRIAEGLLSDPDRLLTAVLFWNLLINIVYFAIASSVSLRLRRDGHVPQAGMIAVGSLVALIFCSELLPKSLAVLRPRLFSMTLAIPLAATVRMVDPVLGVFRTVNLLSRRLIWPSFQPEPYLEVGDLERAVEMSAGDVALVEQEQTALQNIVALSDIRVDELMRPRLQFHTFRPPVSLSDLKGRMTPSGYLLITDPKGDDVTAAVALKDLTSVGTEHLEFHAEDVIYVPWSTCVSAALEELRRRDRRVAAVVNEFGETIGVLTLDDILDTIFTSQASRSERLLHREPIHALGGDRWNVTGMTSLRRLARHFHTELPATNNVTVAGVLQETLQRLPRRDDEGDWGPFHFRVIAAPDRGQLIVELSWRHGEEASP